jgi:hypothetical protein
MAIAQFVTQKNMKTLLKRVFKKIKINDYKHTTLSTYGKINGTDKVNEYHCFADKNYLDIYSLYFNPLKNVNLKMLEIGIKDGASLRTFRDFFKKGKIIGLDIDPKTSFLENGIVTYIGSQASAEVIEQIFKDHPEIAIVLDDGSHVNELTIKSFRLIFPKLAKGGYYIIEDLVCSYLEDNLTRDIQAGGWPGMDLNDPAVEMINRRADVNDFFQSLLKDLDFGKGEIEFIHFWSQICIIKKIG